MPTVSFPATSVTPAAAHGVTVHAIKFRGQVIYTDRQPAFGRSENGKMTVIFEDRFFAAAENAAIHARLAALPPLGVKRRRKAWAALASELGVPYSRLTGCWSGGESLREFF